MNSGVVKFEQPAGLLKAAEKILLLYIFLLPLRLPFSFRISGFQVQFIDAIFLVSFILWILAVATKAATMRTSRLYFFIGLFVASMSVSTLFSADPGKSLVKLAGVYYLAALAVLAFNLCERRGFARSAVLAFVFGAALTGIGTIVAVLGWLRFRRPAAPSRVSRTA